MSELNADQLQQAVEQLQGCKATLSAVVEVTERFCDEPVWHGVVHVFSITGNPESDECYAWSSVVEGSDRRRFYAILKKPPIQGPSDAVRAAIIQENQ